MSYERGKRRENASGIFADDSSRIVRSPYGCESSSSSEEAAPNESNVDTRLTTNSAGLEITTPATKGGKNDLRRNGHFEQGFYDLRD